MKIPSRYRRPVLFALLLHVLILLVLIFNFGPTVFRAPPGSAPMKTVQATAVSEAQLQAAVHAAHPEARAPASAQKHSEAHAQASVQKHSEARVQTSAQKHSEARVQTSAQKRAQKQAHKAALAHAQKAKKLAQQKKIQALQQKLMQQQLNSEAKDISSLTSQAQQQGAIDKYKAAIVSAIQSNWRIDQINRQLKCIYTVNLAPDGTVLSVQLVKSSGSDSLDQSAKQAITLASPLPVPNNPVLFNHFRQLVLTLSPQGVVQG